MAKPREARGALTSSSAGEAWSPFCEFGNMPEKKTVGQHRSKRVRPPFLSESGNHLEEVVQLKQFWRQLDRVRVRLIINVKFCSNDRQWQAEFGPNRRQVG
jgi:hypothetical protein